MACKYSEMVKRPDGKVEFVCVHPQEPANRSLRVCAVAIFNFFSKARKNGCPYHQKMLDDSINAAPREAPEGFKGTLHLNIPPESLIFQASRRRKGDL